MNMILKPVLNISIPDISNTIAIERCKNSGSEPISWVKYDVKSNTMMITTEKILQTNGGENYFFFRLLLVIASMSGSSPIANSLLTGCKNSVRYTARNAFFASAWLLLLFSRSLEKWSLRSLRRSLSTADTATRIIYCIVGTQQVF